MIPLTQLRIFAETLEKEAAAASFVERNWKPIATGTTGIVGYEKLRREFEKYKLGRQIHEQQRGQ
jgi:hypothetical protein